MIIDVTGLHPAPKVARGVRQKQIAELKEPSSRARRPAISITDDQSANR